MATALADAHGRLLLIDNAESGPARRLLDGMALPWSENTNPTTEIEDPSLAAAANNHRAAAAKRWRTLIRPISRGRGQDQDRGQGYGLDVD
ncbi:hypothetical protein AWB85_23215 [Mycobacteroides immunogenum]|uniref:Uncharacterized protein n=1 Tax=Mycobacteroides immunogenum TaxID=83262 RepID=A0A179VAY0_9MYCO|nr:hypothetical protein [Mycobacteroides immunogenum]OAT69040.1 hypothetical protein AWB85_23215 [Mycobacteroides immunogenum]